MKKAFKYRLYPNKEQEQKLQWTLDRCRELYNAALQERKEAWKYARKSIVYNEQQNALPEIKALREEYKDIHAQVLQNVLRRVDGAFRSFFLRVRRGEKVGFPRYLGRYRYDSFTFPQAPDGCQLKDKKLILSKIGGIKVRMPKGKSAHPPIGKMKTCTIKRESEQWYCIFICEVEPEKLPVSYEDIGIDLGITHFAALSDGSFIDNPRYYRKAEETLERRSQALSRKKKGSHRREKARKLVTRAHRKIKNQRKDFLHKGSRKLVNRYQVIVFEDLQTANLSKRPKPKQDEDGKYLPNGAAAKGGLNKSILDAGWSMFVDMCSYKAAYAGRILLRVNPRYTSQVCSGCGQVRKKSLDERWHSCECGTELDRDHNAAINILRAGYALQSNLLNGSLTNRN